MRVLVTGGTGFLGKHIVKCLEDRGHAAITLGGGDYDLRITTESQKPFAFFKPDVVVHAACPHGGGNVLTTSMYQANLLRDMLAMSSNVLEACRTSGVKRVITIGSAYEYPDAYSKRRNPFNPQEQWLGLPAPAHRAYGLGKRMLCELGRAYQEEFGLGHTHLILSNLFGPGDKERMIANTIHSMITNPEQAIIWGNGEAVRDFNYVEDAAREIVNHVELEYPSDLPFNVCSNVARTVAQVVQIIAGLLAYKGQILWDHSKPNGEIFRALKRTLDPVQITSFEEGLRRTIEWVRGEIK